MHLVTLLPGPFVHNECLTNNERNYRVDFRDSKIHYIISESGLSWDPRLPEFTVGVCPTRIPQQTSPVPPEVNALVLTNPVSGVFYCNVLMMRVILHVL